LDVSEYKHAGVFGEACLWRCSRSTTEGRATPKKSARPAGTGLPLPQPKNIRTGGKYISPQGIII
ncbi:MAG: hypothetical protein MJ006_05375, partial [Methanocorpusculum sp.]|nr:hypothetical protein [Methanocorpusculum sp.]